MKGTYYIDSNVFLYPVLYNDLKESETAREILSQIEGKNILAYTSTLTWDEVSYVVERTLGKTDAIEVGRKFLNFPFLRFIPVDDEIIRRSQVIREKYNRDILPRLKNVGFPFQRPDLPFQVLIRSPRA
ncbi:MAG: type II toxin-antitoxin system VapC family toxin [Thermoplasmataceae archaeon]